MEIIMRVDIGHRMRCAKEEVPSITYQDTANTLLKSGMFLSTLQRFARMIRGTRMLHSANRQELGHLLVLSQILVHLKLPLNLLNAPWLSIVPDAR